MPYIDRIRREAIDTGAQPENMGELTYLLTRVCVDYLAAREERFQVHGEILGALEATTHEYYRRRVRRYEDAKLLENGDAYNPKTSGSGPSDESPADSLPLP